MLEGQKQCIAVVGCGHVGLVTAAGLAALGHAVTGIDTDRSRVALLQQSEVPFAEPQLENLVFEMAAAGRLRFTANYRDGLTGASMVFLCVSTPAAVAGAADLSYVRAAVATLASVLVTSERQPVIVNKSTSPIGTGETIDGLLRRAFAAGGATPPTIASNPEFLREGQAVHDFFHPSRIVAGAADPAVARTVAALYRGIRAPVVITDLRTAEMIKYVSNAYLATRVSFANEVARLCEALEVESETVLLGAGMDPRIGSAFFRPGVGYGGSCLPKDVSALCHVADSLGIPLRLLNSVQHVNTQQKKHVVNSLRQLLHGLEGRTIAVWGLTFKSGTDDLRDSPAVEVVALLRNEGAIVRCYDPAVPQVGERIAEVTLLQSAEEACRGAQAICILTDWPQFREVDLKRARLYMAGDVLYDGWNVVERRAAERAGFRYGGIGHPLPAETAQEIPA